VTIFRRRLCLFFLSLSSFWQDYDNRSVWDPQKKKKTRVGFDTNYIVSFEITAYQNRIQGWNTPHVIKQLLAHKKWNTSKYGLFKKKIWRFQLLQHEKEGEKDTGKQKDRSRVPNTERSKRRAGTNPDARTHACIALCNDRRMKPLFFFTTDRARGVRG
jgi:hypothetical protein